MTISVRLAVNPTPEQLALAYAQGLLRKEQMLHGAYYRGHCRNTEVARWHAPGAVFVYWRSKFGHRFLECISHPEDEKHMDVFLATECVEEPKPQEIVEDALFEAFGQDIAAHRQRICAARKAAG